MIRRLIAYSAAALALATGGRAEAQSALEMKDYRRLDRRLPESPQNFAFELRFGPYVPQIDDEFGGKSAPFASAFGSGKGFYIGAEIDWQALRIPYFGTLGPGFSWGYTSRTGSAKTLSGEDSAEETELQIMPMYLAGVLRVDVLARHLGVPLVPYGKLGLGLGLWGVSNERGTAEYNGTIGRGRSWGTHAALGGMLHLDFLEPDTALAFDEEMGVNNTYLYFEWMWSSLNGSPAIESKPQMHVGTSGWTAGITFEF